MMQRRCFALAVVLTFLGALASARAADLMLVEKGKALAPIVIFKDAPPFTRQAADELAQYIEKSSGAKMQVIEGTPQPMPEKAIWVGYQPALKELFPKVDFDFKHPEEILIAANDKHLVIAGRDRWDAENLAAPRGRKVIEGIQQEYGTANAVSTFLQDHLGVRWLWPGAVGEDILKKDTIAFAPFEYRYHPQFRSRNGLFWRTEFGRGGGDPQAWARRQRLLLDSMQIFGGHAFSDWWVRFHKTHPEYFALQPDGTRSGYPSPNHAKLCASNPAVWDQWMVDVEEQIKKDPNQTIFNAAPNDGYTAGHCVCDNCRAWDHPDGELLRFTWKGITQEYVAMSDRDVTFANTLARMLKARHPDKDYYVMIFAYGNARPAPVKAVPDKNVIIGSVANFHLNSPEERKFHMGQLAKWAKLAPNIVWRPNMGSPAGGTWGMPDVAMRQGIEDFRFVAENNCVGLFFDTFWMHWATQGPHYYTLAQMAWNPRLDGNALLEDYYRRAFGPAAADMKAYWTFMEETRQAFVDSTEDKYRRYNMHQVYNDAFFAKADTMLKQADAALAGAPEIYRKRVDFVRFGLDFSKILVRTRTLMAQYEKSRGKDAEAAKQVKELWQLMDQKRKEQPHSLGRFGEPPGRQTIGMHPDNPAALK